MLTMNHVYKSYGSLKILEDVSLSFPKAGLFFITGRSGEGKSTLLHLLSGLDLDFQGEILWDGVPLRNMKDLQKFRFEHFGFMFQSPALFHCLSARDNIAFDEPESFTNREKMMMLAQELDLDVALEGKVTHLSGGEKQRVTLARAMMHRVEVLFCDEPTGALDYQTGKQVLGILQDMSRKKGATVVIVTHNGALAPIADRVIRMHDAKIKSVEINELPQDIATLEY